jgi:propanol-preferring alcohol dehydrogenase
VRRHHRLPRLRRSGAAPGSRLGVYGFGGSAHLATQIAVHEDMEVHVFTRSERAQVHAMELGAASAGGAQDPSPAPLETAILFAPAGELVPTALAALDRGGVLAIAGIHLSEIPPLDYRAHLFFEREVRSVTANTRRDGEEFLDLAARVPVRVTTTPYPLERAEDALANLATDRVSGAAVLRVS